MRVHLSTPLSALIEIEDRRFPPNIWIIQTHNSRHWPSWSQGLNVSVYISRPLISVITEDHWLHSAITSLPYYISTSTVQQKDWRIVIKNKHFNLVLYLFVAFVTTYFNMAFNFLWENFSDSLKLPTLKKSKPTQIQKTIQRSQSQKRKTNQGGQVGLAVLYAYEYLEDIGSLPNWLLCTLFAYSRERESDDTREHLVYNFSRELLSASPSNTYILKNPH